MDTHSGKTDKSITIYDISKKAGVSTATVSRVMNGSENVSPATRKHVLDVMKANNYEPNIFARGLGSGSSKTIGLLCSDVSDIYLANAVSYLERELREKGFNSILHCTGYDYDAKIKGMRTLLKHKVDAIVLIGSHYIEHNDKRNDYIRDAADNVPVMMLNGYLDYKNIYCTLSDDYTAFRDAVDMLLEKGNRNIVFLYTEDTASKARKLAGYMDAHKEHGVEVDTELIIRCSERISGVRKDLKNALITDDGKQKKVDALIATGDESAIGALKYFIIEGYRIPEEISIVGCNNSVLSISSQPELTSLDNMCENLCIYVVNNLMNVLEHHKAPRKTMVSCRLVKRNTTK